MQSAAEIWRDSARMLEPPARVPVSDYCDGKVYVATPGGYNGWWKTPKYLRRPMNLFASRQYQGIVFSGPAQSAKTFGLVDCLVAYNVWNLHADMLVVQTRQDIARDYSNGRLARLHRHTPGLAAELVADHVHDKQYRAGNVIYVGWPTVAQLSGKALLAVLMTDYDRFPPDIDGEGPAWDLAWNRIKTFLSRGKAVAESSPKGRASAKQRRMAPHELPAAPGITALYNFGTREKLYWPCTECEEYFEAKHSFDSDYLYIPEHGTDLVEAAERSRLICPHCGALNDIHRNRPEMLNRAEWVAGGQAVDRQGRLSGEPPRTDIASFALSGYAAAFQRPKSLVLAYLQARQALEQTGDDGKLMTVWNTQLGAAFPSATTEDLGARAAELEARAEPLPKRVVVDGVRYLVANVDVQKGRFVVQVDGRGVDQERWIVDRFSIRMSHRFDDDGQAYGLDPAHYPEDWRLLTELVLLKRYPLDDDTGRTMGILRMTVDTGGEDGVTDKAYAYWRGLRRDGLHRRVRLVKGVGGLQSFRVRESFPDSRGRKDRKSSAKGDVPVLRVATDRIKDSLVKDLERADPGPRYVHIPDWLPGWWFDEVTAETRTDKGWEQPTRTANEAWDLLCYGTAAVIDLAVEDVDWSRPPGWAQPWDTNSEVQGDDEPPTPHRHPVGRRTRARVR